MDTHFDFDLDEVAGWLRDADQIVVLTGAGISTESGIPDFRGPKGVWTKNPAAEKTATLQYYMSDPEVRAARVAEPAVDSGMWTAEPNAGHRALVELERKRAPALARDPERRRAAPRGRAVARHRSSRSTATCARRSACRAAGADRWTRRSTGCAPARTIPACLECGGILKSATISFGENLVAETSPRPQRAAAAPTCSSRSARRSACTRPPALPEIALRNGARLVIVNAEETPFDRVADAVIRDQLGDVLPALAARV